MDYNFQMTVRSSRPSIIREFANKTKSFEDAVNLTLGEPDFHTPERIKQAGIRAIEEDHTGYTNNDGIYDLRKAACDYFQKNYGLTYDPEWEMMVTCGATEALEAAFRVMLGSGDEIMIPAPSYPGYEPLIRFCGAMPIYIDTSENNFILSADMLEKAYSSYSRCLLLSYPNNPTGAVMNKSQLQEIADWLTGHPEICVISDEIYAGLTYKEKHVSIASLNHLWERTIVINGVSKSHAMTGWRIGFLAAPIRISDELYKVHQAAVTCTASISQYAALEALKDASDTERMKQVYMERSEYLYGELVKMGFSVVKPKGAFYMFPSIRDFHMTSMEFATKLLDEFHVGVVPGTAFSTYGEGYIRLSYAASMEQLKEGVARLKKFVMNYKRIE
ncbi:MAG: aminotransferase class I/II-fold pyridoxal phosphate-dependent enzyme [Lachnospiraceae bacterium]